MNRRDMLSLMAASFPALLIAACQSNGSPSSSGEGDEEEKRDY